LVVGRISSCPTTTKIGYFIIYFLSICKQNPSIRRYNIYTEGIVPLTFHINGEIMKSIVATIATLFAVTAFAAEPAKTVAAPAAVTSAPAKATEPVKADASADKKAAAKPAPAASADKKAAAKPAPAASADKKAAAKPAPAASAAK
jgi:hypothetical protein